MDGVHIPVLLTEVLDGLNIKKDGIYVDLTLGRAGHASEILARAPLGHIYGVDQDIEAIAASRTRLSAVGPNFTLIHANFLEAAAQLHALGVLAVDGVLMDLGVSSPQFDEGERGFSYRFDAPLDMRMDQTTMTRTAFDIVNFESLQVLTTIFRDYGEEKFAYKIAQKIVEIRQHKSINTTFDLVDIIKQAKPQKELAKKGHPAKQVFQALRIAVNDELNVLEKTLSQVIPLLKPNGRLAVITFQSLEDRIVKNMFKAVAVVEGNKYLPYQKEAEYRLINRKVITASASELENNNRAAPAKLRILERK